VRRLRLLRPNSSEFIAIALILGTPVAASTGRARETDSSLTLPASGVLTEYGDKGKEEPRTVELHLLEGRSGATFGDWTVWRYDEFGKAIFVINQKTGYSIYLPWSSNGWINYRDKDGEWYVRFSTGASEKQDRKDLKIEPFLKKKTSVVLENGKYTFKDWTVTVSKDSIDFHCSAGDDRMIIRPSSAEIVHKGRPIGNKK
jgi:hypothetical protein